MIKRLVDIFASFFGLLFVSPILLLVMFLVWKEDKRSPFYIAHDLAETVLHLRWSS
jgi:lipopolysaccharide/colanic/teichoic acid biosynthesis glycosyltransferase